jgi:hypothetical protein
MDRIYTKSSPCRLSANYVTQDQLNNKVTVLTAVPLEGCRQMQLTESALKSIDQMNEYLWKIV